MTEKEQIEELASNVENALHNHCRMLISCNCNDCEFLKYRNPKTDCQAMCIAKNLYNECYRKLSKDSVVITKEEYERLKHFEYRVRSGVCMTQKEWFGFCNEDSNRRTCLRIEEREQERKETATEILQYIGNLYDDCDQRFRLKDYQWHKNLCKKYGVEKEIEN